MSTAVSRISDLVIEQLSRREMRLLSLVVAIRKDFGPTEGFKGDLTASVKSALRALIHSKIVSDEDGTYALISPQSSLVEAASPRRAKHA